MNFFRPYVSPYSRQDDWENLFIDQTNVFYDVTEKHPLECVFA